MLKLNSFVIDRAIIYCKQILSGPVALEGLSFARMSATSSTVHSKSWLHPFGSDGIESESSGTSGGTWYIETHGEEIVEYFRFVHVRICNVSIVLVFQHWKRTIRLVDCSGVGTNSALGGGATNVGSGCGFDDN